MKKKHFIITAVLVLILVIGGFFWWILNEEVPREYKSVFESLENYKIKETPEGTIVENKNVGLTFKVPEKWRLEKPPYGETYINLYSPDETEENELFIKTGCKIIAQVKHQPSTIAGIKEEIEKKQWRESLSNNEIIQINGYEAVKNILKEEDIYDLFHFDIYIPTNNRLYFFGLGSNLKDQGRCSEEFEKFLETISINNN